MAPHMVQEKGGIFYFFPVQPEAFALDLYVVLMSFIGANVVWIYAALLCYNLDQHNAARTVDRLIMVQIMFAFITAWLWGAIYKEQGRKVATHVVFYIWFGAKIMTAILEMSFFPKFYISIFQQAAPEDLNIIVFDLTWGAIVIMAIEVVGLLFAQKHFKSMRNRTKSPKIGRAYIEKSFSV